MFRSTSSDREGREKGLKRVLQEPGTILEEVREAFSEPGNIHIDISMIVTPGWHLPWIVHGSVLKMLHQGYGSENVHVTCDEVKDAWQGTEGGGQVDVCYEVGESVEV